MAGPGWPALGAVAPQAIRAINDTSSARLFGTTRPNLAAHIDLVARFAALCRVNGIKLTVATAPMRADRMFLHDPADLHDVVERLSRIVPLWDFTAPQWLAADIGYWDNSSHFKAAVADMMLNRMFGSRRRTILENCAARNPQSVRQAALSGRGNPQVPGKSMAPSCDSKAVPLSRRVWHGRTAWLASKLLRPQCPQGRARSDRGDPAGRRRRRPDRRGRGLSPHRSGGAQLSTDRRRATR